MFDVGRKALFCLLNLLKQEGEVLGEFVLDHSLPFYWYYLGDSTLALYCRLNTQFIIFLPITGILDWSCSGNFLDYSFGTFHWSLQSTITRSRWPGKPSWTKKASLSAFLATHTPGNQLGYPATNLVTQPPTNDILFSQHCPGNKC